MSHETHAHVLLDFIEAIEGRVYESLQDGSIAMIDANETARLLRALVQAAPRHFVSREAADRKHAAVRNGALISYSIITTGWGSRP